MLGNEGVGDCLCWHCFPFYYESRRPNVDEYSLTAYLTAAGTLPILIRGIPLYVLVVGGSGFLLVTVAPTQ